MSLDCGGSSCACSNTVRGLGLRELVFVSFFNHDTVNYFSRRAEHGDSVAVPALEEAEAVQA